MPLNWPSPAPAFGSGSDPRSAVPTYSPAQRAYPQPAPAFSPSSTSSEGTFALPNQQAPSASGANQPTGTFAATTARPTAPPARTPEGLGMPTMRGLAPGTTL